MRIRQQKLDSPNGGGFDNDFIFTLPKGISIHEVAFVLSAMAISDVKKVVVEIDGVTNVECSGEDLSLLQALYSKPQKDNTLIIPFSGQNSQTWEGATDGLLTILPNEQCVIRLSIGAGNGNPSVDGFIRYQFAATRTALPRIQRIPLPQVEVGERLFSYPHARRFVRTMILTGGAPDKFKIVQNGQALFVTSDELNRFMLERNGLTPQDGHFAFVPAMEGFEAADKLNGANARIEFSATEVGATSVLIHTIEPTQAQ